MIRFCFHDLNKWIIIFTFVTWLFMTSSKLKEQPWLHHTLLHKLRFPPWDCWHTFAGIGLRDGSSATKDFQEVFTAAVRSSQGENHSAYFFMDTSWCFFNHSNQLYCSPHRTALCGGTGFRVQLLLACLALSGETVWWVPACRDTMTPVSWHVSWLEICIF